MLVNFYIYLRYTYTFSIKISDSLNFKLHPSVENTMQKDEFASALLSGVGKINEILLVIYFRIRH